MSTHAIFHRGADVRGGKCPAPIITSTPPLDYLCVICNSNRFHSFIFKLCIMIVNRLKMCTGDAGSEQSLVLFIFNYSKLCLRFRLLRKIP